jgi:flagellar protein FlaJ
MAKIETLKEVRLEFSNIIRDVALFGGDLLSSILSNAKLTPHDQFKETLEGYVATVRTGGNPTEYLRITTEFVTKERLGKLDMMLESLAAMAEIYIMMLVAAPLLFIVLFVTLGMIGSSSFAGFSMSLVLNLMIYLGIPILGAIMMVIMSTFEK